MPPSGSGARIFAISSEGGRPRIDKASLAGQAELLELDPVTFVRAAYVGRFGWVTVDLARVDGDVLAGLLLDAWRLTAPKRSVARMSTGKPSDAPETKAR